MILLDTDMLTHLFAAHPRVSERCRLASEKISTTIITQIEILEGRFAFV